MDEKTTHLLEMVLKTRPQLSALDAVEYVKLIQEKLHSDVSDVREVGVILWNCCTLPPNALQEDSCNPYYLVRTVTGHTFKAMYIEGKWKTCYLTELSVDVLGWAAL